jgi:hypothetical protein
MIVKCTENKLENVCNDKTQDMLRANYNRISGEEGSLEKGQCYVVYSLFVTENDFKWYLLKIGSCPIWYPEIFFEIIVPTPSKYWMTFWVDGIARTHDKGKVYSLPEYDDDFYYNLVDCCEKEVGIFNEYVNKIKNEAIL